MAKEDKYNNYDGTIILKGYKYYIRDYVHSLTLNTHAQRGLLFSWVGVRHRFGQG